MTTEVEEKAVEAPKLSPEQMPWEVAPPMHPLVLFVESGGPVEVKVGYAVYREAILLVSFIVMPNAPWRVWRRHWTSYDAALRAAENMVGECLEYLHTTLGWKELRPAEDLDYEDFLEHLAARLNNNLH